MSGPLLFEDGEPAEDGVVEVIPFSVDKAIDVFLNRWLHRALYGDRDVLAGELKALVDQAVREVAHEGCINAGCGLWER
jgi:hypothetical protein